MLSTMEVKNQAYEALALKLYEQERLRESYNQNGKVLPWEQEQADAYVSAKAREFRQDASLYAREAQKMAEFEKKLPGLYLAFVNENELTAAALGITKKSRPLSPPEQEYFKGIKTAEQWKHGRMNPDLSYYYFEIEQTKGKLLAHLIEEDRSHMLGRPRRDEDGLRRQLGEWKYAQSEQGRKPGKVEVFLHDAPDSERYRMRLALMAGIGVQHAREPADSAMLVSLNTR